MILEISKTTNHKSICFYSPVFSDNEYNIAAITAHMIPPKVI